MSFRGGSMGLLAAGLRDIFLGTGFCPSGLLSGQRETGVRKWEEQDLGERENKRRRRSVRTCVHSHTHTHRVRGVTGRELCLPLSSRKSALTNLGLGFCSLYSALLQIPLLPACGLGLGVSPPPGREALWHVHLPHGGWDF